MRYFKAFCNECIDNCKHKSARTCPYIGYYKANKEMYRPTARYHIKSLVKKGKVEYISVAEEWKKFWAENDPYILKLYQQGKGYKKITNILGKSNPATVRDRLIKMGAVK